MYDESLVIDTHPWIGPHLARLIAGRRATDRLWPFTQTEWAIEFGAAVQLVGLSGLHPSLYSNRHGGASEDLLSGARSVEAVKRRGRWKSDSSLRRYGKEARLLSELGKVPLATRQMGDTALTNLEGLFADRSAARRLRRKFLG